jgi:hypothetical protein
MRLCPISSFAPGEVGDEGERPKNGENDALPQRDRGFSGIFTSAPHVLIASTQSNRAERPGDLKFVI